MLQFLVSSEIGNHDDSAAIVDALESAVGTRSVEVDEKSREDQVAETILTICLLVIVTSGTAAWVSDVFYKIRQRFAPLIILDLTGDTTKIDVRRDAPGMRGHIVVKAADGEEVSIEQPGSSVEMVQTLGKFLGDS